jgi:hypothetical protein
MLKNITTLKNVKIVDPFIINAGAVQLNNSKYVIKNIKIYKSPLWLYCNVKIHNILYKRIYPEELFTGIPYCITIDKYNDMSSLLCNNAIIYQRDALFDYKLEFILDDSYTNTEDIFYEYIIKDIKNSNSNYIYTKN